MFYQDARLLCVLSLPFLFRCLPAVRCGLGGCARGQGAGERPHAAGAQVEQRRAHPQVQLPPVVRAQSSPQPHALPATRATSFAKLAV
jgi:hypothetical protein